MNTIDPPALTVLLHRQKMDERESGTLRAYVVQDGHRGSNLLSGRHITGVDTAKRETARKLPVGARIEWEEEL